MSDKTREEFEAFASTSELGLRPCHFLRDESGGYESFSTQCYWQVWQASRASIELELPEQRNVPDRDCWARTNALGYNTANQEFRTSIESLGLKVKP